MPVIHETVTYDVHDFKIYSLLADPVGGSAAGSVSYGPSVDVPGIAEISVEPNFQTSELKGDARVIAKKGRVDKFTLSATYGKLAIDVLKVLVGGTVTDAATSATWLQTGANSLPYFKAVFAIYDLDLGLGSAITTLYKCQLTGGTLLKGSSDEFGQPELELEAIPLANNDKMIDITLSSDVLVIP